jgi:hypothetical protein
MAGVLGIIGGIFILIGGGTGMVGFLNELREIIKNIMGDTNQTLETICWILIFIAALGGIAVIIGGLLIYKNHVIIGRILIALGAGIGIGGLIIGLIISLYRGAESEFFAWLTTSFLGIGIIVSLIARFAAKRPGPV